MRAVRLLLEAWQIDDWRCSCFCTDSKRRRERVRHHGGKRERWKTKPADRRRDWTSEGWITKSKNFLIVVVVLFSLLGTARGEALRYSPLAQHNTEEEEDGSSSSDLTSTLRLPSWSQTVLSTRTSNAHRIPLRFTHLEISPLTQHLTSSQYE